MTTDILNSFWRLLCITAASNPSINLWAVVVHGHKIPCTAASLVQLHIHVDLLHSPSMSAFTPRGHSAPSQRSCPGCRHGLVVVRQEPALPSPVKEVHGSELTSFEKMFWKFCLCPQQLKHLTCWQGSPLSSVCAWCGGDKAPSCSQGVCAGSFSDAQSGLHVLVSFSLGEFEKQQQALKFVFKEADLRLEHRQPLSVFLPLALHFVFTGVIFSKSQVMTNSGSIYKFYSLNMKTKLEQRRIKQYPLFQKQQKKTLSLQTLV